MSWILAYFSLQSWELNSGYHTCYTVQHYWVTALGTMVHSEFIFMTGIDTELFSFRFPFHSLVRVRVCAHMLAWGKGCFYFYPDSFIWREHIHRRPWFSDPAWDTPALQMSWVFSGFDFRTLCHVTFSGGREGRAVTLHCSIYVLVASSGGRLSMYIAFWPCGIFNLDC